eukprot:4834024-Ditylum_brightwellii.AAC.1
MELYRIEGQIFADALQHGCNFCATAKVSNNWNVSVGKGHVDVSTIKHHLDNYMKSKKINTQKVASDNTNTYSPW